MPEDSFLVGYTMFLQLNDGRATRDVRRGMAARILPPAVYDWIYPTGTPWDAPMVGEARAAVSIPAADVFSLRDVSDTTPPAAEQGRPPLDGSNNWAVSGKLTESGRAIVSNDMHLRLNVPNVYYRARLIVTDAPEREASGVTLPGEPFIIAGSNGKVAWGFTNSYGDWSDAVLIRPGDEPNTYRTPDGDQSFKTYVEMIEVKGGDAVEHRVRETIWGPVVKGVVYPDGEIAVSWIAHFPDLANLRMMDLETAGTATQALDIANSIVMPPQNFVVGDAAGNIGWTIAGRIPIRANFNAMLPADWSEIHGWQGWLAAENYPRILNPDSGRIWTANARVVDDDALRVIGDGGYDLGARASQIRDGLFAKEQFEPEDMLAIQIDDRALFLERWQSLLLQVLDDAAVSDDPELREYHRLVKNWIPRAVPESVGYRLVRAFRLEVRQRVFHALMAPVREVYGDVRLRMSNQFEAPLWSMVSERPEHMLPVDYESWNELLLTSARENLRYFKEKFDGPLAERSWGEHNTAMIRHPLSRALPALSGFFDMPREPLDGDVDMPRVQSRAFGASERFAVYPGDEANSLMHMPGGQSGHPLSDYYRRGHRDWAEGRPAPFLPGQAQHKLILRPATR
jgi:penicillin amidase